MQNIQDVNYNCAQVDRPVDPITASTTLRKHDADKELQRSNNNEENTVTIDHIEALLNSLEGVSGQRVPDPDIHKRQLKHIAERVLVPPHTITNSTSPTMLKSILDIPRAVSSQFQVTDEMSIDDNDN